MAVSDWLIIDIDAHVMEPEEVSTAAG